VKSLRILGRPTFWLVLAADVCLLACSYVFAHAIRFEFQIPLDYQRIIWVTIVPVILTKLVFFWWFSLYRGMWRFTSVGDLLNVLRASAAGSAAIMVTLLLSHRFQGFSRSAYILDGLFTVLLIGGSRLAVRLYFTASHSGLLQHRRPDAKRLLIVGAGGGGEKVVRELHDNPHLQYDAVGFVDDDPGKQGMMIHGRPVLGTLDDLAAVVEKTEAKEVLIAIPSATSDEMRRAVALCRAAGVRFRTLPAISEFINGKLAVSSIREVDYMDLLGREPVHLELGRIGEYLTNARVLITGAGGSIGSELVRQVIKFSPGSLVLLDRTENSLFEIDNEVRRDFPYLNYTPVLADIQNEAQLEAVFGAHRPEVVFHAAAYKHVPMMELHPWEAVKNNIVGTQNVLRVAGSCGTRRFVLVSTDKAVRPSNVMGASKRVTELLVRAYDGPGLRCITVRFGNVIGSSGSVIPLFKKQIERGGPVTVTHPEVSRYFMSIPEAAQLILQAGAMGEGGEIFVLDMGRPVKIQDVARDLIKLMGLEPEVDIQLQYIGLRPGEKLHEELVMDSESSQPTGHRKISRLREDLPGMTPELLAAHIEELLALSRDHDAEAIRGKIKELVPEYTYQAAAEPGAARQRGRGNVVAMRRSHLGKA
jgi:FlaA1/EpsC-like NDP-sugar epimerase